MKQQTTETRKSADNEAADYRKRGQTVKNRREVSDEKTQYKKGDYRIQDKTRRDVKKKGNLGPDSTQT